MTQIRRHLITYELRCCGETFGPYEMIIPAKTMTTARRFFVEQWQRHQPQTEPQILNVRNLDKMLANLPPQ